jgi:predicted transposase/invertase (TIGR01784 family)
MSLLPLNEDILPPSEDYIFKTLLTHPDTKPALIDLVAAVIGREVAEIEDVQILYNEPPTMDANEKNERLDVNCVLHDGTQVNVEMQGSQIEEPGVDGNENFLSKYIYYLTDLHSSQKSKGVKYYKLARTYQVTFSTYTIFPERKDYITSSSMRTPEGELISDRINMVIIELSKLGEVLEKPVEAMSSIEMWSAFLGYASDPSRRRLINEMIERKEALGMASTVLMNISKDDHERAKFRSRRKFETDLASNILTATDRGRAEGEKKTAEEMLELIKSGYTLEQIEKLLQEKINM